jgi:serine-type D-Ala-D-Ala carboxypeptidase
MAWKYVVGSESMNSTEKLNLFLSSLVLEGAAPGAVATVSTADRVLYQWHGGHREIVPNLLPMQMDTMFDLASLTKVVATTMAAARLNEAGELDYSRCLKEYFPDCGDFAEVTIMQLLTHTGGFMAETRLSNNVNQPNEVLSYILHTKALYHPGTQVVYSCFGFIVLGAVLEKVYGATLDKASQDLVFNPLGMNNTLFCPLADYYTYEGGFAATEVDEDSGQMLSGVVHDENARFLGGTAGNAGCFSTMEDLLIWCKMILSKGRTADGNIFLTPDTIGMFSKDFTSDIGESRGVGFKRFPQAFGHTGFTGTSVWIDPKREIAALLLTNRVHPFRTEQRLLALRQEFYDLAAVYKN